MYFSPYLIRLMVLNCKHSYPFLTFYYRFCKTISKQNCNSIGIKLVTKFRLGLSHLSDHKFKHNFLDFLNPICCCGNDNETAVHYLLHCSIFLEERSIFLNNIRGIDENILSGSDSRISETLLFGISSFNDAKDTSILNTRIDYILSTKRFDVSLTNS